MNDIRKPCLSLLLYSQDKRLAQTRQWLLEQARFHIATVYSMDDLDAVGSAFNVTLFLLCNSLSAEIRAEVTVRIRVQWPDAKILIFVPTYPLPELPVDEFFQSMEGPAKLIQTIQGLISSKQASMN